MKREEIPRSKADTSKSLRPSSEAILVTSGMIITSGIASHDFFCPMISRREKG